MNLNHYKESIRQFGVTKTAFHASYRAANQIARVVVWKGMTLVPSDLDVSFVHAAAQAGARSMGAAALRPYVRDDETLLSEAFLDDAERQGDRCVAFFEDERLISYGWYSTRPTRLGELDRSLVLEFDSAWVYMYNGYTVPRARGRRLHAYGMAHALVSYSKNGFAGLIGYIDVSNFASLRSSYRLGYRDIGYLCVLKVGERYLSTSTPGCRRHGMRVRHVAQARSPAVVKPGIA